MISFYTRLMNMDTGEWLETEPALTTMGYALTGPADLPTPDSEVYYTALQYASQFGYGGSDDPSYDLAYRLFDALYTGRSEYDYIRAWVYIGGKSTGSYFELQRGESAFEAYIVMSFGEQLLAPFRLEGIGSALDYPLTYLDVPDVSGLPSLAHLGTICNVGDDLDEFMGTGTRVTAAVRAGLALMLSAVPTYTESICFYGRAFNASSQTWIDQEAKVYSIGYGDAADIPNHTQTDMTPRAGAYFDKGENIGPTVRTSNPETRIYLTDAGGEPGTAYMRHGTGANLYLYVDVSNYGNAIYWINSSNSTNYNQLFPEYPRLVISESDPEAITGSTKVGTLFWSSSSTYTNPVISGGRISNADLLKLFLSKATVPSSGGGGDPYGPGGNTSDDDQGGDGTFDLEESDTISPPTAPGLDAVSIKFITIFRPSQQELDSLASYMWGSAFDLSTFKKLFADPMQAVLGLSIVPVAVPSGPSSEVVVGNIGTGIYMTKAAAQYVSVDCGSLTLAPYWGGYLDYSPYTKAWLYLPYIGTRSIDVDDFMGHSIGVTYLVDILSGAMSASVTCDGSVMATYSGQCSMSLPITGQDYTHVLTGAIRVASSIGSMVATGGGSAPTAVPAMASAAVNALKPEIQKSGTMGSMAGMLSVQVPYLIIHRPRQAVPGFQDEICGYPSFRTVRFGSLEGYTEVEAVHLSGIPGTEEEILEIESLLKGGVTF